jgi:hypothetical protein
MKGEKLPLTEVYSPVFIHPMRIMGARGWNNGELDKQ